MSLVSAVAALANDFCRAAFRGSSAAGTVVKLLGVIAVAATSYTLTDVVPIPLGSAIAFGVAAPYLAFVAGTTWARFRRVTVSDVVGWGQGNYGVVVTNGGFSEVTVVPRAEEAADANGPLKVVNGELPARLPWVEYGLTSPALSGGRGHKVRLVCVTGHVSLRGLLIDRADVGTGSDDNCVILGSLGSQGLDALWVRISFGEHADRWYAVRMSDGGDGFAVREENPPHLTRA
ncbi:hypothetical protein [Gemmata sp.]|uniref:hypothetical protein n=1 Tax=Gemmata sp. TaxID=1914242 RepID=UPI003F72497E